MPLKKRKKPDPTIVRRGFDFDLDLYNQMRSSAAAKGEKTRDFLTIAIKRELKRRKKRG